MIEELKYLISILISVILGFLIGYERKLRFKRPESVHIPLSVREVL